MHRALIVLAAGSLVLSTGLAFAQGGRAPLASRTARIDLRHEAAPVDPNSAYARSQAAVAQGFAPIDTDRLGRGFNNR